jgi:hypothetical protein
MFPVGKLHQHSTTDGNLNFQMFSVGKLHQHSTTDGAYD